MTLTITLPDGLDPFRTPDAELAAAVRRLAVERINADVLAEAGDPEAVDYGLPDPADTSTTDLSPLEIARLTEAGYDRWANGGN